MTQYFETAIQYYQVQENGKEKKVTESYLVDALSFTEAEARTIEYATVFITGDLKVIREKPTNYSDIVSLDKDAFTDVDYYRVKVLFVTIDERTAAEKKTASLMCVAATSTEKALANVHEYLKTSMTDYEIDTIQLTNIKDVIKYDGK